jgi:hypothetical protein
VQLHPRRRVAPLELELDLAQLDASDLDASQPGDARRCRLRRWRRVRRSVVARRQRPANALHLEGFHDQVPPGRCVSRESHRESSHLELGIRLRADPHFAQHQVGEEVAFERTDRDLGPERARERGLDGLPQALALESQGERHQERGEDQREQRRAGQQNQEDARAAAHQNMCPTEKWIWKTLASGGRLSGKPTSSRREPTGVRSRSPAPAE